MAKNRTTSTPSDSASSDAQYPWIAEPLRPLAVPIETLLPDPANAKTHGPLNIDGIAASLRVYGQQKPVVVRKATMTVVAGNGTLAGAKALGWTHIAASVNEMDAATAAGYAIIDNRAGDVDTGWGPNLDTLLGDLVTGDAELDKMLAGLAEEQGLTGAGEVELKQLDTRPPPKMTWILLGIPTVRFGEIAADVERLAALPETICETTSNDG